MNDLYYPLIGSTCFGLSPVHHQKHHFINCITHWYVRTGEFSCCVDVQPRNSNSGGRDSSVGIATRYGLDGPGIESQWGARFSAPVQTGPGAYPASCTMGTGSFPGVKRPERGTDHSPHLRAQVMKGSGSCSAPQWSVIGRTFTFM